MKWIKLLGIGVLGLIALAAFVLVVGMLLPVEHSASSEAVFAAPLDRVWATITDFDSAPQWRSRLERVEKLPPKDDYDRVREYGADGTLTFEIRAHEPPTHLVTRIADEGLPFGGTWTYELSSAGTGTQLRITEDGKVYDALFRVVGHFVIGHNATMEAYLRDLAERLQEPVPDIVSTVRSP